MSFTRNAACLGFALAGILTAQTKISGTLDCAKPDVMHVVPVGDSKEHVLMLTQNKCTWSKPLEMEGIQTKDDIGTGTSDARATSSHDQGYDVSTMSNGDKLFVRNSGMSKMKGEMLESMEGKWSFTGGTGKFKGLKGGGTFKGSGKSDGTVTIDVDGEYTLPK